MQKQHLLFAGGLVGVGDGDGLGEDRGLGAAKLREDVAQRSPTIRNERTHALINLQEKFLTFIHKRIAGEEPRKLSIK